MATAAAETKLTPPYLPWKTFKGFLENLKSVGVPGRIDSSVMRAMSGSAQSQMRTGMRFLDLIDDGGSVTSRLQELVGAVGSESWKETLAPVLTESYSDVLGDLDIRTATLIQLNERFRNAGGVEGSVREKAIRFFLAALSDAGIPYSPHLVGRPVAASNGNARPRPRAPRAQAGRTRREKAHSSGVPSKEPSHQMEPPPGSRRFTLPVPGKTDALLVLPESLTAEEWEMIDSYMRKYIELRSD